MSTAEWKKLADRLQAIYDSGEDIPEPSDLSNGEDTRFFDLKDYPSVAKWIKDAVTLGLRMGAKDFVQSVEWFLYDYARLPLAMVSDLDFCSFERPEGEDPSSIGDLCDPINTRYRFQLFIQVLIAEARAQAEQPPQPPPERKDYWTLPEWSGFLGLSPARCQNWVSEYRRAHKGQNPPFVIPSGLGPESGFRIKKAIFLEWYDSGQLQGLRGRRS